MKITEGEFRGKPIFIIKTDDEKRILFSAGLKKCQLILENLEALKLFIDRYSNKI